MILNAENLAPLVDAFDDDLDDLDDMDPCERDNLFFALELRQQNFSAIRAAAQELHKKERLE